MANGPRALANHSRYLAGIQLAGWQHAIEQGGRPVWIINAAYAGGLQLHLRNAYGWLLLMGARVSQVPAAPPACVDEVPSMAPGIVLAAELRHCQDLERDGWLAELLTPLPCLPQPTPASVVLASTSQMPDLARCSTWCDLFDQLVLSFDIAVDES